MATTRALCGHEIVVEPDPWAVLQPQADAKRIRHEASCPVCNKVSEQNKEYNKTSTDPARRWTFWKGDRY